MTLARQILSEPQPPSFPVTAFEERIAFSALLGNHDIQTRAATKEFQELEVWVLESLNKRFAAAQPASRLAILKQQKFTSGGREQRIMTSLAALDADQPTKLSSEQWREVVEEVEDED